MARRAGFWRAHGTAAAILAVVLGWPGAAGAAGPADPRQEMLRNEIRYTNALDGIPADLDLETGKLGPPSLFGAAEYAKDGLIAITELLGRTPWFHRMCDMTADLMTHAPVASDFGPVPDPGAELNGDVLQTLVRLAPMTGDRRFLEWAERIGDACVPPEKESREKP